VRWAQGEAQFGAGVFLRKSVRNVLLSRVGREAESDLTRGGRRTGTGSPLTAGPRWRCSRDSGFSHARRQCLRAVAWPQRVEQNEGEECSAEACREPLRGRPSRLCQRGSVITSDRRQLRLVNRFPKGELGSRSGFTGRRHVPGPAAVGSAAGPGRRLPAQENIAAVKERRRESEAFAA
jgi:hypothetical protein